MRSCPECPCRYIDYYKARKDAEALQQRAQAAAQAAASDKLKAEGGDPAADPSTTGDAATGGGSAQVSDQPVDTSNKALETIMALLSERAEVRGRKGADAAAADFLANLPGPPPRGDVRAPGRDRGSERDAERRAAQEFERERKRERQEAEKKLRQAEPTYNDALRQWERWERWVFSKPITLSS